MEPKPDDYAGRDLALEAMEQIIGSWERRQPQGCIVDLRDIDCSAFNRTALPGQIRYEHRVDRLNSARRKKSPKVAARRKANRAARKARKRA